MDFALYAHPESGHSYKVKLALEVTAIAHDFHIIDLTLPRARRPEPFRSLAPYGEVPLLLHKGEALVQSDAILHFLASYTGRWGGESEQRLRRTLQWLFWEANRLGLSLPHLRYAKRFAPEEYPADSLTWLRARFDTDIARLAQELKDGRQFILDDEPTVADFSLCGYLFWSEQADVLLPEEVTAWLGRISKLPGWQAPYAMMAKQP